MPDHHDIYVWTPLQICYDFAFHANLNGTLRGIQVSRVGVETNKRSSSYSTCHIMDRAMPWAMPRFTRVLIMVAGVRNHVDGVSLAAIGLACRALVVCALTTNYSACVQGANERDGVD